MGKCVSKNKRPKTSRPTNIYYKPKVSSKQLLSLRLSDKGFKEITIKGEQNFQSGSIFGGLDSMRYVCIGGLENGDQALLINLITRTSTNLISPPMSLSYGNLIPYQNNFLILGSLTIEATGQEEPAPPLKYEHVDQKWSELPVMPFKLGLYGSFLIDKYIHVLGGYLNYPKSPSHFRTMLVFNIETESWVRSNVETPILQGLPACCVVSADCVLVIGGHDPCERVTNVESRSTYLFNGSTFEPCADIPLVGQLRFQEAPMLYNQEVFIYSDDDILFIYSLRAKEWGYIDCEQSMNRLDMSSDLQQYQTMRTYLYRFVPDECEIVEYNITFGTRRNTGPSNFKYTFQYTGMCMLSDGRLFFAGGITEDEQSCKSTWTLNPKLKSSSNTADLPHEQHGVKMVCHKNTVYAVAGQDKGDKSNTNWCQKYTPATNTWAALPPMHTSVFLPGVSVLNDTMYVIAGQAESGDCFIIQTLDLIMERWKVLDLEYPCSVYGIGCIVLGSKILCFGGKDSFGLNVPDAYLFDGEEFEATENLPDCETDDALLFLDPSIVSLGKVYAVSVTGIVFSFVNSRWEMLYT